MDIGELRGRDAKDTRPVILDRPERGSGAVAGSSTPAGAAAVTPQTHAALDRVGSLAARAREGDDRAAAVEAAGAALASGRLDDPAVLRETARRILEG